MNLTSFASRALPSVGCVLEIGASSGALLREMASHYGCQTVGVELGDAYRAFAKSKGCRMVRHLDEIQGERFDLICMSHVLEHIADPVGFLVRLREDFLSPGGHLLVEVPNVYGHESFEPAHLFSFSKTTLNQTLSRAGFRVEDVECHGRPKLRFQPLYLTAMATSSDEPFVFTADRGVNLKRRIGMLYSEGVSRVSSSIRKVIGRTSSPSSVSL